MSYVPYYPSWVDAVFDSAGNVVTPSPTPMMAAAVNRMDAGILDASTRLDGMTAHIYRAVSTGWSYTSSAYHEVNGLNIVVTSTGLTDVFTINVSLDIASTAANAATFVGNFNVDSATLPGQVICRMPTNGQRQTISQNWAVTNLPAGSHTFLLGGYCTSDTPVGYTVNDTHSQLTIRRDSATPHGAVTVFNG